MRYIQVEKCGGCPKATYVENKDEMFCTELNKVVHSKDMDKDCPLPILDTSTPESDVLFCQKCGGTTYASTRN